jgi:hypothetical protein
LLLAGLLLACAFLLVGCGGAGAPPPGIGPAVFAVVTGVWKLRSLGSDPLMRGTQEGDDFDEHVTDYGDHVKFFLRWRAEAHLAAGVGADQAKTAIAAEYDLVRAYVNTTLGPHPASPSALVKATDTFPHLDLADKLRRRTADPPLTATQRKAADAARWERANSIVWRAAALELRLWKVGPTFDGAAMGELLDRRLRMVERMIYQVNDKLRELGTLAPTAASPRGPWPDGVRVRPFEYPLLATTFKNAVGPANIGPGQIWREDTSDDQLVYNEGVGTRIRAPADAAFGPAPPPGPTGWPSDYGWAMKPVPDAAQLIDHLFEPKDDWWGRSWLYCDEVLAALHLDALRIGKRRRLNDGDAFFNGAIAGHPLGWAGLRPVAGRPFPDWRLMGDDAIRPPGEPRVFSATGVPRIQLGDHVVFFNTIMYSLLYNGAWSLENAVVVGLKSDWRSLDYGDGVLLMGHGTGAESEGKYRSDMASTVNAGLALARIQAKAAAPGANAIAFLPDRQASPLVQWSPYGETWTHTSGPPLKPWWIRVPYSPQPDWQWRALGPAATLRTLPDAIDPNDPAYAGPGFTLPPAAGGGPVDAAYYPLWRPAQPGGWKGYLTRRKAGTVPTRFVLDDNPFDGHNIPGLVVPEEFTPGVPQRQVYTVRPFVG